MEPDADGQTVSKDIDPDEIVEKTVNEAGQIYLGSDLAGDKVTVAYEAEDTDEMVRVVPPADEATLRQYILQQSQVLVSAMGASVSQCERTGTTTNPDAIVSPSTGANNDEMSVETEGDMGAVNVDHPVLQALSKEKKLHINVVPLKFSETDILHHLANAINEDAVCVFAHPRTSKGENLPIGLLIEGAIYNYDDPDQFLYDYTDINCALDSEHTFWRCSGDKELHKTDQTLTTENGNPVVIEQPSVRSGITWIKNGVEVVGYHPDDNKEDGSHTFCFECPDNWPPSDDTLHRERDGDSWVVKHGRGDGVTVVDEYDTLDALQTDYADVSKPFVPAVEFDRHPTSDDFVLIGFPRKNTDHVEPVIYEEGEERPLLPNDT